MDPAPIKLDLRNLTQDHINEALPNLGECLYSAPCIIGTLIPESYRDALDNEDGVLDERTGTGIGENPCIDALVAAGIVEFPDEQQAQLATDLQLGFDNGGIQNFRNGINQLNRKLNMCLVVPGLAAA